jgi:hypothetical protein
MQFKSLNFAALYCHVLSDVQATFRRNYSWNIPSPEFNVVIGYRIEQNQSRNSSAPGTRT